MNIQKNSHLKQSQARRVAGRLGVKRYSERGQVSTIDTYFFLTGGVNPSVPLSKERGHLRIAIPKRAGLFVQKTCTHEITPACHAYPAHSRQADTA